MLAQLDEALNHYNMAIELSPKKEGEYLYNRGLVKSRLDMVVEAVEDYKEAIIQMSKSSSGEEESKYQAYFNRGICLRRLGRLQESIDDLEKARTIKADKSSVHNNLGLSYFEKGEFELALQSYDKAI